jgi:hypothetical protein
MADTRSTEELFAVVGSLLEAGAWTHEARALAELEQRVQQLAKIADKAIRGGRITVPESDTVAAALAETGRKT